MSKKYIRFIALIMAFLIFFSNSSEALAESRLPNKIYNIYSALTSNINLEKIISNNREKELEKIMIEREKNLNIEPQIEKYTPQTYIENVKNISGKTNIITWANFPDVEYDLEIDGEIIDVKDNKGYYHNITDSKLEHIYRVRTKIDGKVGEWSKEYIKKVEEPTSDIEDNSQQSLGTIASFTNRSNSFIEYSVHTNEKGWSTFENNAVLGQLGYIIDGIKMRLVNVPDNIKVKYRGFVKDIGWQEWVYDGAVVGVLGKELQAIEVKLIDATEINNEKEAEGYNIQYNLYCDDFSNSHYISTNGETSGIIGKATSAFWAEIINDSEFSKSVISKDTRWTVAESPYIIDGELIINQGVKLTIDPGVKIIFKKYVARVNGITVNGVLEVNGNSQSPVIFNYSEDGNLISKDNYTYKGINITSTGEFIGNYCNIEQKGIFSFHIINNGKLNLNNSIINTINESNISFSHGVLLENQINTILQNTTIKNCNIGIIARNTMGNITLSNNKINNNKIGITSLNTSIGSSEKNIIKNNEISENKIGINISGKESKISTLEILSNNISKNKQAGILFEAGDSTNVIIQKNTITGTNSNRYNYSSENLISGPICLNLEKVIFYNNQFLSNLNSKNEQLQNKLNNNNYDGIVIKGKLNDNLNLLKGKYNYIVDYYIEIPKGNTLNIEPGTIINIRGSIRCYGNINAEGTKSNPIIFTSIKDDKYGVNRIQASGDEDARDTNYESIYIFEEGIFNGINTKIRFGGKYFNSGDGYLAANLDVSGSATLINSEVGESFKVGIESRGKLDIINSKIYNCEYDGITLNGGDLSLINSTLKNNNTGVFIGKDATASTIVSNSFIDNISWGIINGSNSIINAEYNYWGSPSGPTYNENGHIYYNGDWVNGKDKVDFDPYLATEYKVELDDEFNQYIDDSGYRNKRHFGIEGINSATGNFSKSYTDLSSDFDGYQIAFVRTYNSMDSKESLIGKGWNFGFQGYIEEHTNENGVKSKVVTLPNGSVESFKINSDGTYTANDTRSTLKKLSDGTFVLTNKNQDIYSFNSKGKLISIKDRNDNKVSISVANDGKINKITDGTGRSYTINYSNNLIDNITEYINGVKGRVVKYSYKNNLLSSVTDGTGKTTLYEYDSNNRLHKIKDKSDNVLETITYIQDGENKGKVDKYIDIYGNTKTYSYDNINGRTLITDSNNKVTEQWYDSERFITFTVYPDSTVSFTEYFLDDGSNKYGEIKSETDRNRITYKYERDKNGNRTKVINPDSSYKSYVYDDKNNLIKESDENGNTTYYEYDEQKKNLLREIKPLDGISEYKVGVDESKFAITKFTYYSNEESLELGYKVKGLLKTVTDPEGYKVTNTYYENGNIKTITNQEGKTTTFGYDSLGNKQSEISPSGYKTLYVSNSNGDIVKTTLNGNETSRIIYDDEGKKLKEVDANQYDSLLDDLKNNIYRGDHGTRYSYYPNGNLKSIKDAEDNITIFEYDLYGNMNKEIKPNGAIYIYEYDDMNRLIKTYFENTDTGEKVLLEENEYLILSNSRTQKINKKYLNTSEVAITYSTFDYADRLLEQVNPDNSTSSFKYNPNGTIAIETDENNSKSYFYYDGLNRETSKWIPFENTNGTTKYTYTETKYDKNGYVISIKNGKDLVEKGVLPKNYSTMNNSYYKDGKLKSAKYDDGRRTEYIYDNDGYLKQEDKYIDSKEKITTKYIYNHLGEPTKKIEYIKAKDIYGYGYSNSVNKTLEYNYTYDKNGNLKTISTPSLNDNGIKYDSIITTFDYDRLNRKISESKNGIDEFGNPITINNTVRYNWEGKEELITNSLNNSTEYIYNKRGFLEKIIDSKGGITAFYYDLAGRKIVEVSPLNYSESKTLKDMERTEYVYDLMDRVKLKINKFYEKTYNASKKQWISTWTEVIDKAYEYDKKGNIIKELDAIGYETANGSTVEEKITNGYGMEYTYNLNNNLINKLDPESKAQGLKFTEKYEYDALGRKYSETNGNGVGTSYELDDYGNILKIKMKESTSSAENIIEINKYDLLNRLISKTDGNGNTTTFTYNNFNEISEVVYPGDDTIDSHSVKYQYDLIGNLKKEENSDGNIKTYDYDSQGNIINEKVFDKNNETSTTINKSTKYDKLGNVRFEYDGNGNEKEHLYDELNRLISTKVEVTNSDNVKQIQTTSYEYDKNSNNISKIDWRGNVSQTIYDGINRIIEKRDPYTVIERIEYNHNNSQVNSYDALDNKTQYTYDKNNRLISTTDPEGHKNSQSYDCVGNIILKVDGNNNSTSYEYNQFNKLKKVINAKGEVTEYNYDLNGNMISQKDGNGNTTLFEYNVANKVTKRIDPDGRSGSIGKYNYNLAKVESYNYFSNGNLKEKVDRNGNTTKYEYNILGLPVKESTNNISIKYTYDKNGNMLTMTDDTGTTERCYDELNRVIKKVVPDIGETKFKYDLITSRSDMLEASYGELQITPDGNMVSKFFDKVGRIKYVLDGNTSSEISAVYEYYGNGSTKAVKYKGGIKEEYSYFKNNLLKTLSNVNPDGTIIESFSYEYDNANNQVKKVDKKGITKYTYDKLNRISTIVDPVGVKTSYEYDAAGNRKTEEVTKGGAVVSTKEYIYNNQNRLISTNTISEGEQEITPYTYDNNGNLLFKGKECINTNTDSGEIEFFASISGETEDEVSKDIVFYEYDDLNRLVKAEVGGETSYYKYNGEGLRIEKTVGNETIKYLYEGSKVILEVDESGTQIAKNIYGTNLIKRKVASNNEEYYYLYNGHGDVTALTNGKGEIKATYYYDAFGVPIETTGNVDNSIRYAGYQYDEETGNYYLLSRMYDPNIARFLQEDTYRGNINDPLSLNLYTYVHNNPITYDDPNGHWIHIAIGALVGGAINTAVTAYNDYKDDGKFNSGWKSYAGSFVGGAIVGGVGAATFGMSLIPSVALGVTSSYIGSLANQYISTGKVSYKKAAKEAVTDGTIDLVTFGMGKVFGKTIKTLTKNKATKQAVGITKDQLSSNSSFVKDIGKKVKSYLKDTFDNMTLAAKDTFNNQQKTVTLSMNGAGKINEFCDNLTNIKNSKININKTSNPNVTKGVSNPIKIDEYGILKNDKTVSGQAHHLNQNAAYRDVVPPEKGISIKLEGNAFTQPGTPHYNAHESMEGFWNQFRRGGDRYGEMPTNLEYSKAVFDSMQNSGFTRQEALDITRQSIKQRLEYGLLGGEPVPRIPGRIYQVK